jgi:hypothetical protein
MSRTPSSSRSRVGTVFVPLRGVLRVDLESHSQPDPKSDCPFRCETSPWGEGTAQLDETGCAPLRRESADCSDRRVFDPIGEDALF